MGVTRLDLFRGPTREPEGWRDGANCRDALITPAVDPWFDNAQHEDLARRICASCRVRVECLKDGLEDEYGIWGGWSPTERDRLRASLPNNWKLAEISVERAARLGPAALGIDDNKYPTKRKRAN